MAIGAVTLGAFALSLVPAFASYAPTIRATCSNFSIRGEPYTQPGPSPYIISAGIVCSGTTPCNIPVGGFVTVDRSLNVSSLDDATSSDIYALIASSGIDFEFEESLTSNITATTQRIQNGTAGYVAFTPNFRCVSGTLNGCPSSNQDLKDGTIIEACTPIGSEDDISGTISPVVTDEASAKALICNPANVSDAADAPNKTCRSSTGGDETSDAGRVSWVAGMVSTAFICALGFAGGVL